FSDKKYEGISLWITDNAFNGTSEWQDPVLKLFLTSTSLEAGLQGGEVPSLFEIGTSLGSVIGQFVGISPSFIEALEMITVFRCTTNSP
ncbi:MAG: chloride channel protein, partial [Lactococcus sp.]|nr:chloride channel protein [Lactococcus sp.]